MKTARNQFGLLRKFGEGTFRALGYGLLVIAGAVAAERGGFFWFAGLCLCGHVAICASEVIDRMESEGESLLGKMVELPATETESCDQCRAQEGRHYCLLHGVTLKNMDTIRCTDFEPRGDV